MTTAEVTILAGTAEGLRELRFDGAAGRVLADRTHPPETAGGVFCATSDQGTVFVLAAGEPFADGTSGRVRALRRASDGTFQVSSEQATQGNTPCYAAIDSRERLLAVTNFRHAGGTDTRGSVVFLPLEAGLPGPVAQRFEPEGRGPVAPRQVAAHPHCVRFVAGPDRAFVADLGTDSVWEYPIKAGGRAAPPRRIPFPPGSGPRHLALPLNGHALLVLTEMGNRLHVREPDVEGNWRERAAPSILPPDQRGGAAADVQTTTDGRFAYASLRGPHTIAAFRLDGEAVELIGHYAAGGRGVRAIALTPDETWLVVANNESGELSFLPRDRETGRLAEAALRVPAPRSGTVIAF